MRRIESVARRRAHIRRPRSFSKLVAATLAVMLTIGLVVVPSSIATAATAMDTLTTGDNLTAGQYLISAGSSYKLAMQSDGNLVIYSAGGRPLWASDTSGHAGAFLTNQTDGNLVVYSASRQPLWDSGRFVAGQTRLIMQGDGNLVQYGLAGAVWNTGTAVAPPPPPVTGNTLTNGQTMHAGQQLADGGNVFIMQTDGNAVVYSNGTPLWSTRTSVTGSTFTMQTDGNAVLYAPTGALFSTQTSGHPGARMIMQSDGNLVVYASNGVPLWSSTQASAPPAPPTSPAPPPPPPAGGCHPTTSTGNCYEPGEFCPAADHGVTGVAGDGKTITCKDVNGWRWD